MTTFYSEDELCGLGLKRYGANVLISRNAIIYKPDKLEIGSNVRIDDFVTISGNVVLGNYIHIAQNSSLFGGTAGILMDDFSGISSHVAIYAVSNDYSGRFMTNPTVPDKYTCDLEAAVHLGRHVIVGCGSVVLPGVTIPVGCSIGAMSLCNKDLVEWGIYAGTPVKRIKDRRKDILELEKKLSPEGKGILDLQVGDFAERKNAVVYENAVKYAAITGDDNPIHFELGEAYQSRYGRPVAHGMIFAGFISGVIGSLLPGTGCIYESQNLSFIRPVFYNDEIITRATVIAIDIDRNRVTLKTECFNQEKKLVLDGEAVVLPNPKV
jgi:galactoside O-acetyltransferase